MFAVRLSGNSFTRLAFGSGFTTRGPPGPDFAWYDTVVDFGGVAGFHPPSPRGCTLFDAFAGAFAGSAAAVPIHAGPAITITNVITTTVLVRHTRR